MPLSGVRRRRAGRFLEATSFGRAKSYYLDVNGKVYDSKAIIGYAHGVSGDRQWRAAARATRRRDRHRVSQ
jgi:hypothetical protein